MESKIELQKNLLNRNSADKVLDRNFNFFFQETSEDVDNDTVEELFRLYDKLFYEIPKEGEENSHQYLVERSSDMYKSEERSEEIQPLLEEISELRERLLENQKENANLNAEIAQLKANE